MKYARTPLDEPGAVCLILVEEIGLQAPSKTVSYIPAEWNDEISVEHREYIRRIAKDWHDSVLSEARNRWLEGLSGLSVGPLRIGASGVCTEGELSDLLDSIFKQVGYRYL